MTVHLTHPSPNHGTRRDGLIPSLIVIHYTAMATAEEALDRLCDPATEVSSHYLIDEAGRICRLIPETRRAWHAGAGRWGSLSDVNSASVGIELANDGTCPFPPEQMAALVALLAEIRGRWNIPPKGVIGHSDMAPGRKTDPGALFDWQSLAEDGQAVWPETHETLRGTDDLWGDLARFGYPLEVGMDAVLDAFRLRFRPGVTGPADETDRAIAADLARRFPVDPPRRDA
nr:N-acetylmuramoyl-L-alanine amidase [Rhodophyticola sp. MJ-SS7]